jgi:hypothetical protein
VREKPEFRPSGGSTFHGSLLLFVILIRDFAYREIDTILGESKRLETLKSRR